MIKLEVLKIIYDSDQPICDDCIASNQKFNRIQVNKRCTQLARDLYILRVTDKCTHCSKTKLINTCTEDGAGFLNQHEKKRKISDAIESDDPIEFNISIKCQWLPVISSNKTYLFPEAIDKSKNSALNHPAVYRWIVINNEGAKTQNIYIGEATELAQRIYHYIKPGPSQKTNIRMNKLFYELISEGYSVTVEQLKFEPFKVGQFIINIDSLQNKFVRRILENLLTGYYGLSKYTLMNA